MARALRPCGLHRSTERRAFVDVRHTVGTPKTSARVASHGALATAAGETISDGFTRVAKALQAIREAERRAFHRGAREICGLHMAVFRP